MENQDRKDMDIESLDELENEPEDEENDMVETENLTIKGHLLKWGNHIIQISNISLVSSGEKEPPHFPMWILWLTIIGIIVSAYGASLSRGYRSDDEMSGTLIGVGILILAVAVIGLVRWFFRVSEAAEEKYLHIHLNSGNTYSILFADKDFLDEKVMPMFSKIFQEGAKDSTNFYIDIRNSEIKDSNIGSTVVRK